MPPRRFKDLEDCREKTIEYIESLERGTDDDDPAKRQSSSTQCYRQDLRWLDHWLDEQGIESTFDLTMGQANKLGGDLSDEFNGTTPRYRWDRIYAMYDHFVKMRELDKNPLEPWDDSKTNDLGLPRTRNKTSVWKTVKNMRLVRMKSDKWRSMLADNAFATNC